MHTVNKLIGRWKEAGLIKHTLENQPPIVATLMERIRSRYTSVVFPV